MKKLIYPILALVMILAGGCQKEYFDINENPNSPTSGSITPDLILPRSLHATASRMATGYGFAGQWCGYWARSGTYGPSAELESYDITTSFQAGQWSGWYDLLFDVHTMEQKATTSNQPFYVAAAKVLKAIGFMNLVDQYNNVPYSKAFDVKGNILPTYDNGQDIYNDLLVKLDEAGKGFAATDLTADPTIKSADIMFKGDLTKWRKLVNTLRLKLLLRQSQVFGATIPTAEIAKITADGSGYLGAGETANVQPGYVKVADQQNPFWNTYKSSATGAVDDYNRANNYVLNKLRTSNDIRYKYFFSIAATPLTPITDATQYYGYNFGENVPNSAPKAANSSDVAGPGLAKSVDQPQWLLTSFESLFLQAEAIARGWLPGNAKTVTTNAVTESFTWLGVTNAATTAANYLAQGTALVDYDSASDKPKFIVMQKYLSMVGVNNLEAWVDYRRLGVPADLPVSMNSSVGTRKVPLRLRYPQAEYNYNLAAVTAQGTVDPQATAIFWDK